ncbi:MAG: hypothetical protein LAT64_13625 [Phycisphaerales bacterium]|nr:hypothetical protein [Planctomycetota bacterium]MCH8509793.1 hypothetical protein [Phycisphaerales bacterium]
MPRTPHLRLTIDEPETEPPAPFPIREWRRSEEALDAIEAVEHAFDRAQRALDRLSEQLDEAEPLPFPGRMDDDDGPWAA